MKNLSKLILVLMIAASSHMAFACGEGADAKDKPLTDTTQTVKPDPAVAAPATPDKTDKK